MHGNRELISQALANLVDNAIKYAAPTSDAGARTAPLNGVQPEIVVKAAGEGDRILLTVADTGPGIPEPTARAWSSASCGSSRAARSRARGWA